MKSWLGAHWVRSAAIVSAAIVVVIVAAFGWLLSTHANPLGAPSQLSSGLATATVSSVTNTATSTASSASTATPDPAWATILIQSTVIIFDTGIQSTPGEVAIDPSNYVRVAVDGSGQVAGFFQTFTYTPVFDNKPYPVADASGESYGPSQQVGSNYTVPQNCVQQLSYQAGVINATNALSDVITNYEQSTGGDTKELDSFPYYPISYDSAHVACNPGPGYTQSQPFAYAVLEPATVRLPMFRYSDLVAYRIQQAKALAPTNYVYESIHPCYGGSADGNSATFVDVKCPTLGQYRWNWTSADARTLASQIAGKDTATASSILAQYPGASIYKSQGVSFQITGSSELPTDPTHITFKIYDTVLIGTSGVQTTGTPLVLP